MDEQRPKLGLARFSGGRTTPPRHCGRSELAHCVSRDKMTLGIESTVDCVEGENEPLSLTPGFKALDISFSSSDGKMKMACWHCCPDCGVSQSDCRAIRLTGTISAR